MTRVASVSTIVVALLALTSNAREIDYLEDFALATDRTVPLGQLIPGTEDYYYYHCLHYQNTEQFDKVEQMLKAWIKRYKYTPRVREIQNRQALLTYGQHPHQSLEFIQQQLGIRFDHQRETMGEKPTLPTRLDPRLIGRDALHRRAAQRYQNLQGYEDSALEWLVTEPLNPDRRRHLLERLERPDYPNLPRLVVDDLNYRNSRGFGSLAVHRQLLLSQLDECLTLKPALLNQSNFVNTYLTKLHPNADVDWRHDTREHDAYLARLWQFADRLAPVHNSLKAHVLYHWLTLDRSRGIYNQQRFMTYITLPRNASYISRDFMKRDESRRYPANLQQDFRPVTQLAVVGDDEPLVRSYLHHFFTKETTYEPYTPYIDDVYLKHQFAEAKIVRGLGEPEQWYSLLPPAEYQALKERIDLDFAFTNRKTFAADEPVSLDLHVKNVGTLIVKVFEINAKNYYEQYHRDVNTDINLDGLVANQEETYTYTDPPLRRIDRHYDFPELTKPGVYVIDFIGNGRSSRAVVRKGRLRYLVRTSTAGQVFTVMDEKNRKLANSSLWLGGREYRAGEDGTVTVPFSNRPGREPIILTHEGLASLQFFQHQSEDYALTAGIYVDRESLLARRKAKLVVRPGLYLNGVPVTLSVLENVRLTLQSVDHDGVATTHEIDDFKIFEDREAVHEFQVPQRTAQLTATLSAKVQNMSRNEKVDLTVTETFSLNEIDRTDKVEDLHFADIDGRYVVDVLGKTGEANPHRPVQFSLKHRDFREPVQLPLQTDENGRIMLGTLDDIVSVSATGPEGTAHTWHLRHDRHTNLQSMHGLAGGVLELPYMGRAKEPQRDELSLLEVRGNTFVADRFDALSLANGQLRVGGLPPGDYDLLMKDGGTRIRLRLTAGDRRDGYALGESRHLEIRGDKSLQIDRVETTEESVNIQLRNATKFARVHVFATHYRPAFSAYDQLARVRDMEPFRASIPKLESLYVEGRDIGDEYRYIIDRQHATKFPGNMLERPSLLLNPWAIRKTETEQQEAKAGDAFGEQADARGPAMARPPSEAAAAAGNSDFANLDFLYQTSAVLLNLVPEPDGTLSIQRSELGPHQHIHIVAIDPLTTVCRSVSLPEKREDVLDLRLAEGLDPSTHYTQRKQISVMEAGQRFEVPDITSSRFEVYDSLGRLYRLYATLSGDKKLEEFSFILGWPGLKEEEKRAKYSKYACHELNFFLYKKDPEFFERAVLPYLANKTDKTFLDQWLLGQDLRGYLDPWSHERLNIVERVLLAQHLDGEQPYTSRHVRDLFGLIPPNVEHLNHLFDTALMGSSLEAEGRFGAAGFGGMGRMGGVGDAVDQLRMLGTDKAGRSLSARGIRPGQKAEAAAEEAPLALSPQDAGAVERFKRAGEAAKKLAEMADRANGAARRSRGRSELAEADAFFADDGEQRQRVRQFYRKLDKTQEWVENNYYQLPIEEQNADLVTVNAFWNDYANHAPGQPFYSSHVAEASRNFTEMMFALSLIDIPFQADEHLTKVDKTTMTMTAASPMVVYHEQVEETGPPEVETPILVSQNFFRHGDRYRQVNNERQDKFVTDEFLVHTVYGCQVVITNPTSSQQKLDLLLQVPVGALPVMNGRYTRTVNVDLQPFHTQTVEYHFYFPIAGDYRHYPVQVAKNEQLLAYAEPVTLKVVDKLSQIDRESWDYVSQYGSDEQVIQYLRQNNVDRINLDKIAFRMVDKEYFQTVIRLLAQRHVYNQTLWSYGIKHNVVPAIREYLQHADAFVGQCGAYIDSPLVTIDPVIRKTYQHMEYQPLVNARAHQLGARREILNDRFFEQYHRLLKVLSYRHLDQDDLMSVTYYLLLQDRVGEAIDFFERVRADSLATRLQHDYFTAYLDFYTADLDRARAITQRYADYPVDRWRKAFANMAVQLDEISGGAVDLVDPEDRTQTQTQLAATEPSFEFKVESQKIKLDYQNLDQVQVNYYLMDVELLFSQNPFVQHFAGKFSHIRPNDSQVVPLPAEASTLSFDLPESLRNRNVLVEIIGGGQAKTQACYSNSMTLQVIENYGQLRVTDRDSGRPIPAVYVKTYARMQDGTVRFYKDGYTDLRGRFDYTSLNTNELDFVQKLSLLVYSDQHGAVVREADPPKQ